MRKYLFTIDNSLTSRQKLKVDGAIGRILPQDNGKQVFDVDGVIQVENNEQRDARLANESKENEQITLDAFIAKHDLKFTCRSVDSRPDGIMDDSARHFSCRIYRGTVHPNSYQMGLYFSQGSAHTQDPTLADVLDCLASDASGYENAKDFTDWASEYGYDTDSRKAEKVYKAVKRQAEQLKRTIGEDAYNELLWETERL